MKRLFLALFFLYPALDAKEKPIVTVIRVCGDINELRIVSALKALGAGSAACFSAFVSYEMLKNAFNDMFKDMFAKHSRRTVTERCLLAAQSGVISAGMGLTAFLLARYTVDRTKHVFRDFHF